MTEANRDLYVVTKHFNDKRDVERHFVQLPHYNEKGWYVNGRSMDAFKRRMQKRHVRTSKRGENWVAQAMRVSFHYRVQMHCDYLDEVRIWGQIGINTPATEHHHASLKAFYAHIGYDPKANKLEVEPTR